MNLVPLPCLILESSTVVIASDEFLIYQNLECWRDLAKGNELLWRTETLGFALLLVFTLCVAGWMGSVAWPGPSSISSFRGVMLKRGRVLWLVFGRLWALSHHCRAQSKAY